MVDHPLVCDLRGRLALDYEVKRCVLCRSHQISTSAAGERYITASCTSCGAVVRVEFDPPDAPNIRGRIELLVEPGAEADPSDKTH
jgi:hypothetical protein